MDMVGMVNMIQYEDKHPKHVNDIQNARRTSWCCEFGIFLLGRWRCPACLSCQWSGRILNLPPGSVELSNQSVPQCISFLLLIFGMRLAIIFNTCMILLLTLLRSICIQKCWCCPSIENYSTEPHTNRRWLSVRLRRHFLLSDLLFLPPVFLVWSVSVRSGKSCLDG